MNQKNFYITNYDMYYYKNIGIRKTYYDDMIELIAELGWYGLYLSFDNTLSKISYYL